MHIAFNGWFWDHAHTGSGQYLRQLLTALQATAPQHRYTLVVPGTTRALAHLPPDVDVLPVQVRWSGHLGKVWFEQGAFPDALRRLQSDLAHVPYWGPPLRSPVPLVCTVLDAIPLAVPEYGRGLANRLYTGLAVAGARGAARVVAISQAAGRDVAQRLGIRGERIDITPLAADARFHPDHGRERDLAVRAAHGLDDVDDFVLYLGSYAAHKNVRLLLAAYTYVAQAMGEMVPLALAGHIPETWTRRFPDLPATIEELGLGPYVRWLGPIDEADKPSLYRLASVFAFPSRYEGFGLGPLEAMASGTPVVACNTSAIPEVTGDAAFLVAPDDARAMGGAILALLGDPEMSAQLRNRGLARARDFSWRNTAQATLDVYQRVVDSPSSSAAR